LRSVSREDWSALEALTMHRTSRLPHPHHEELLADALLGADHPLARVLQRRRQLLEQSLVVAAVLAASVAALADGLSAALAFVLATAIVESVLVCDAAMLSCSKRYGVLELIVQGRGDLPLRAIACERRRLLDRGHQQHLAAWLDAIRNEAEHPIPARRARPICSVRVIAAAAPDLATIAELLRSEDAGLRGVAATQRLLVDGTSSLYGQDENRLCEELHRIRFLLGS
jgi:hypothetical protein